MHIFYDPAIEGSLPGQHVTLNREESHHCVKVLRLSEGDEAFLVNGRGGFYAGQIVSPDARATVLKLLTASEYFQVRNHYLHIAIAPTKNIERMEWFLEKATEIGIDEVTPVVCERSERKEIKVERLQKVMIAAMKQSKKAFLPKLNDAVKLSALRPPASHQKFVAHCAEGERRFLAEQVIPAGSYTLLIGPEGDFSASEIASLMNAGYSGITLGESRLRTETAALAACFEINYLNRVV